MFTVEGGNVKAGSKKGASSLEGIKFLKHFSAAGFVVGEVKKKKGGSRGITVPAASM